MRRVVSLISAFVLAGALVSACGSSGSKGASGPSVTLHAKNFAYLRKPRAQIKREMAQGLTEF